MNDVVALALVSISGPIALAYLNARTRRLDATQAATIRAKEKKAEWARQDELANRLASRAEQVSRDLTASNREVAAVAKHQATIVLEKIGEVHTLVNSNMTAAMQDAHDSTVRELAALREIARLTAAAGNEPDPGTTLAIEMAETKIAELETTLAERQRQAAIVTEMQKEAASPR
jgi:hypothetical protein